MTGIEFGPSATTGELKNKADLVEGKLKESQLPVSVVSVSGAEGEDQPVLGSAGWVGLALPYVRPDSPLYHAKGDGEHDDHEPFRAAMETAAEKGGGSLQAPALPFAIGTNLDVPPTVNLAGVGVGATKFVLLNDEASIRFGHEKPSGEGNRGGRSGDFTIDGGGVATTGMVLASVYRDFGNLHFKNINGDGLVVNWAQNNKIGLVRVEEVAGNAMVWDFGCESNLFGGFFAYQFGKCALLSRASSEEVLSAKEPRYNLITGGVLEHPGSSVGGGTIGEAEAIVNFEAGLENELRRMTLSAFAATIGMPLVKTSKAKSFAFSARNEFNACVFAGKEASTVGIRGGASTSLYFGDRCAFENLKTQYELADTFVGEDDGTSFQGGATAARFANYEGGSQTLNNLLMQRVNGIRVRMIAAASDVALEIMEPGDSQARVRIVGSGQLGLGSGSATPDWFLAHNGAETGKVTGRLEVTKAIQSVAAATEITVGAYARLVQISGTTEIKKIVATSEGHEITLKFAEALTVKDGENLKLAGDFTTTGDDTLTLICNGTNWYEKCRSVN